MQKFCHNCGKQMPSVGAKFCPFCGTSLSSLSARPTPSTANNSTFTPFIAGDDDDDDSYIDRLQHAPININKLELNISRHQQYEEKIGDIAKGGTPIPIKSNPVIIDKQAFLKEFQQEAGALRKE